MVAPISVTVPDSTCGRPVLRAAGIVPIIINRRHSNEDLNNQIIQQLRGCDFCLTDLTYARQSVYFEAGFAQRQVEVIYTVRRDHLRHGQPDNLRVHFDLQMKPLIPWDRPNQARFRSALRRRLDATVLREWRARERLSAARLVARAAFERLSVAQRLVALRKNCVRSLMALGFHNWHAGRIYADPVGDPLNDIEKSRYLHAMRSRKRHLEVATIQTYQSLRKQEWTEVQPLFSQSAFQNHLAGLRPRNRGIVIHRAVLSLRSVSLPSVEAAFPNLQRGSRPGHLYYSMLLQVHRPASHFEMPLTVNLYVLSGLSSPADYSEALVADVQNLGSGAASHGP